MPQFAGWVGRSKPSPKAAVPFACRLEQSAEASHRAKVESLCFCPIGPSRFRHVAMDARWSLDVLTRTQLREHPGLALRRVPTSAQSVLASAGLRKPKHPFSPGLLWG
jgi:hypothetical protein